MDKVCNHNVHKDSVFTCISDKKEEKISEKGFGTPSADLFYPCNRRQFHSGSQCTGCGKQVKNCPLGMINKQFITGYAGMIENFVMFFSLRTLRLLCGLCAPR
jgi:ferredoxin